jgi:UDP-N-acetylmuramate: L-alanyl-gamma-D-glutamyl-meso-diaminopimelate ligase
MRVFFIGICGTAMGNAAILLKKQGHEVAGSDLGVYPPMSDVLSNAGIELFEGFDEQVMLDWNPDRVVVGNAVSRGNAQVEFILRTRTIPFVSLPQLIGEDLIGNRPCLVVAGTHGKTTTTSLSAFALDQVGLSPGYLVGGVPLDLPSGNELGVESSPFVIEGDEYDSAFFDKRSKFIHYRPRILILNNLEFDHGDIFRDLEDISRSFSHLLRIVPSNGFIIRNGDDENILTLPTASWCSTFSVGMGEQNDLQIKDFLEDENSTQFDLFWQDRKISSINWQMPGEYNARNLAMSFLASVLTQSICQKKEIDLHDPFNGFKLPDYSLCKGVKRRQEILVDQSNLTVISDFAHHPTAITGTLKSLRARWPGRKIIACFEPRSNTAVTNIFQDRFADALSLADEVLLGAVHRAEKIPIDQRINTHAMIEQIKNSGKEGYSFTRNSELGDFLKSKNNEGQSVLIVFFSNGSFDGEIERFASFSNQSEDL